LRETFTLPVYVIKIHTKEAEMKKLNRATLRKMISESMAPFPEGEDPRDPMNLPLIKKGTEMYSDYREKRRRMSVEQRLEDLEDRIDDILAILQRM
jgi:hypothetical protein